MRVKKVSDKETYFMVQTERDRVYYNVKDSDDKAALLNREDFGSEYWYGETYSLKENYIKEEILIPSGLYSVNMEGNGETEYEEFIEKMTISSYPRLDVFKDFNLLDDIKEFVDKKPCFDEMNIPHKRGFLMYGPPGTGKTTFIINTLNELDIEGGYLALYMKDASSLLTSESLLLEGILTDPRLKIFILEELTEMNNCMADVLNLLDGVKALSGVVFIATTNYPENLPENLVNRPSRFDVLREVGYLSSKEIDAAFNFYKVCPGQKLLGLLSDMKITFSHIKEICLKSKLKDIEPIEAYESIKKQIDLAKGHFKKEEDAIGFF